MVIKTVTAKAGMAATATITGNGEAAGVIRAVIVGPTDIEIMASIAALRSETGVTV